MRLLAAATAATLFMGSTSPWAQELPARKPGLWKMAVAMQGMPAGMGSGDNQQCIDSKTDADLQRKALQAGPGDCTPTAVRKTATGHEFEARCKTPQGSMLNTVRMVGDPQSAYTVTVNSRHEPPRKDRPDQVVTIKATWAGACPAGMKPGDVRMFGAQMNVNDMADPKKMQKMKPEELKKMIEQMKAAQGR